ncbi:cbb3-type cytochrome c oxidase subunit I [Caldivirga maquilingensis]|uniref:Nitric oxide reductase, cytochrome b subunit n=1 Tax=Caldivirga maquilingensis (strain ATCC 700844 / DSM 13496 / JCM 10307 / IC-167) TaxID=397948 RepID=A8MAU8_CALMQ|nr:cbb3-type cytochrome c oxidase subunit I [Caldivirga maquilingensis]ABW01134.1 nitric oxide reductase, cytochrome b subunit [Caldivirga maquilingensis IC-167]
MNGKSIWPVIVLGVTILVYVIYGIMAWYTFTHLPPIPTAVETENGTVLFTRNDIIWGKYYFQKYGLMDYGSILGMGSYFGVDFTSYTLRILEDSAAHSLGFDAVPQSNASAMSLIKQELMPKVDPTPQGDVIIVSNQFAQGFYNATKFYSQMLGPAAEEFRLKPDLITNETIIKDLTAYFAWSGIIAMQGYTNGFPYMPGLIGPTANVTYSSWLMIFTIMLLVMPLAGYVVLKLMDYWHEPRLNIQLPPPNDAQKLTLLAFFIAGVGLGIQGLLGAYAMHLYTETSLYGLNLIPILPFNVARALHYTLAILWIAITWIAFSFFVFPYFGLNVTKRQVAAIIIIGVLVSLGTLLGIWLSYLQLIPAPWWFIVGAQGRDVTTQGTLWLILITAILGYVSYLWNKASKTAPEVLRPFAKILSIAIAGTAAGAFIGALPIISPWPDFQVDEYFRWMTIHAFVEGFWPPIVITVIVVLLVIAGLIPPRLGIVVTGMDATLEIVTGMIGTAHHYYFNGLPTFWMYVGAVVSTLEAIPLGFVIIYVILLWRRGEVKTEFQKTLLTYALVAGIGGGIGVVAFGAGLINMPVLNYFLHDVQTTMTHAHLAFPLAYGLPSILMWVVAFYLSGAFNDRILRYMRWAAVIYGVGFYLQALLSLLPLGVLQFEYELQYGFWFIKTLVTPSGHLGFWQIPIVDDFVWLRMIGDLTAAVGIAIVLVAMLLRIRSALSKPISLTTVN